MVDASLELINPDGRTGQSVSGHDVIHEKAINVDGGRCLIDVRGQQVSMPRPGTAVTAHIQVVAPLRGYQAKILPLSFRTLTHAARDSRLDFMRGADAFVAVFQADGEADGILHAVSTPRGPDTALDRT